jgi:hypothetical protein
MMVPPGSLGRLDHPDADPIFDAPSRIQHFELREHRRTKFLSHLTQVEQRSVSDDVDQRFVNLHAGIVAQRMGSCKLDLSGKETDPTAKALQRMRQDGRLRWCSTIATSDKGRHWTKATPRQTPKAM